MKNIAFCAFGTDTITDSELKFMKNYIPESRIKKSERYYLDSDRKNCIASYFILLCILAEKFGIYSIPEINTGKYGKPYFAKSDINFNISHCKNAVCCAVSEYAVGVDIQDRVKEKDIFDMVLSENEKSAVMNTKSPSELFTRFWTQKEAYLKYKAAGLTNDINKYDFSPFKDDFFKFRDGFISTKTYTEHSISVCCKNDKADIIIGEIGEYIENFRLRKFYLNPFVSLG